MCSFQLSTWQRCEIRGFPKMWHQTIASEKATSCYWDEVRWKIPAEKCQTFWSNLLLWKIDREGGTAKPRASWETGCSTHTAKRRKCPLKADVFLAWTKSSCFLTCADSFWPQQQKKTVTNCQNVFASLRHPTRLDVSRHRPSVTPHPVHSRMHYFKESQDKLILLPFTVRLQGVKSAAGSQ